MVDLREVTLDDSAFILNLRNDEELNKYISNVSITLEDQMNWIKEYKKREKVGKEYYFIVENSLSKEKCGTVRIYDIESKKATWGSFILNSERPNGAVYETVDKSLNFVFNSLKLNEVYLRVFRLNSKAIYIYEKVGFIKYKESKDELFFKMTKEQFFDEI